MAFSLDSVKVSAWLTHSCIARRVTKAEVDAIAAWKAKEIGDMHLLERLRALRTRP